ncbi:DUF2225 domain-containing protein [Alloiococcus sp. CFN-8]|uniref:DUF2225 domain-containing protein n=1 Tax=Alloiococcus sp. CFN-8 TaxID=3416081 RepID=UPI003CEC8762
MTQSKAFASSAIYLKTIKCPLCHREFKEPALKTSSLRILKRDSDNFTYYKGETPYFYEVFLCNGCGYAAMNNDFNNMKDYQKEKILKNITVKWTPRAYNTPYDERIAIERYKLALITTIISEGKKSTIGMILLRIAWMYRSLGEAEELLYLKEALTALEEAYNLEEFPIYNLDELNLKYLLGELNRRLGNDIEALKYLGDVITSSKATPRLKNLARDQRDKIKNKF